MFQKPEKFAILGDLKTTLPPMGPGRQVKSWIQVAPKLSDPFVATKSLAELM